MKALVSPADLDTFAEKIAGAIVARREAVEKAHAVAVAKAKATDSRRIEKTLDVLSDLRADLEEVQEERRELLELATKTVASARTAVAHVEAQKSGSRPAPRRFN